MRRPLPSLLSSAMLGLTLLTAAAQADPARAEVDQASDALAVTETPLVEVGEATRHLLWMDLYRVELYLPAGQRDPRAVTRPDLAKAFRVEMLFGGDMPDSIPQDWAEELLPPLDAADRERLHEGYRSLSTGDELLFSYAPGRGTTLEINGRELIVTADRRFMDGIVALFVGPDATSEEVRRGLLAGGLPTGTESEAQSARER